MTDHTDPAAGATDAPSVTTSLTPAPPAILSRDAVLKAKPTIPIERIDVPALGGVLLVRGLKARERDAFEASLIEGKGKGQRVNTSNIRAKLLVRTIVDERHEPLFTEADVAALGELPASVIEPLYAAAMRLSRLTSEDMEELAGNSDSARPAAR